ncbi:MAG: MerR family transcriptional regulator [Lachnospiraceae bacterium]|nr:MerR family transcriptional regulator [Lachnospiraceae bacterium]
MEHLLISDAAKKVQVESHVLRYWEEELKLPIKRNEMGHRYYTAKDIERFVQIKNMKERGLQLKAIKMILKDGKLDVLPMEGDSQKDVLMEEHQGMAIEVVDKKELALTEESKEEKAQRLQWLLKQLIKETLQENNRELSKEIKESVVKELDYQFRCQEERENERYKERDKRDEEYYQRMDELLRKKAGRIRKEKAEKKALKQEKEPKETKKADDTQMEEISWEDTQGNKQKKGAAVVTQREKKKMKRTNAQSPKPAKLVTFKKKRHLL